MDNATIAVIWMVVAIVGVLAVTYFNPDEDNDGAYAVLILWPIAVPAIAGILLLILSVSFLIYRPLEFVANKGRVRQARLKDPTS